MSTTFMSGIYTFLKKTLLYLLAFCVVNMVQICLLIDFVRLEIYFCSSLIIYELQTIIKLDIVEQFGRSKDEKECRMKYIIPIIIAIALIIFFVILYFILFIIMWKNKYWNVTSRTKIPMPYDLKIKFDPKLDKEYEYSNDLNDYDDYDDDNEEEKKDEKIFEKLKRRWKIFYDSFILHITE
ncbi:hypothetical protein RhiirC2_842741 [Rhizophagus irregularis]|uniref:Uncharacterized protein n=1 Tax=Rhizophagus irregularis TaxID=588596 RepID=A0A2N1NZD1_9GLOM|nr:hypothetical protein RhiirC2_842741 [Rhizophagus irregularis]